MVGTIGGVLGVRAERDRVGVADVLRDHRLRVGLTYFVVLQLLDTLTTITGLISGLDELNPVTARIVHRFGLVGLVLQKVPVVIVVLLALTLLPRRLAVAAVWACSIAMGLVIASNVALVATLR